MNGISLFHGSNHIVERPTPTGGKVHNDFGPGFYCTTDLELAREWACGWDKPNRTYEAIVNHYSLEPSIPLSICRLTTDYHPLNWLALLLKNRHFDVKEPLPAGIKAYILENFLPDLSHYDILVGYRADDSYFDIASSFLRGTISLEHLGKALKLGNLGEQYFLQSERAFEALTLITFQSVDVPLYYARRIKRDRDARAAFRKMKANHKNWTEGTFAIDIVRGQWRNDDARLR
ncbi:MAG: DUF3990 domain-containing protein [Bacteroidales bacterium]|nr:DUF3990 domain-containing protein [Bacteroidales bacterium]